MSEMQAAEGPRYPGKIVAWLTVAVLFLLYIRSLADRNLMALMVEPIKQDLGITDFQIGLVQGFWFAVLYAICAIPVGLALDRFKRRWVLFLCIVVWSSGAAACGLAATFGAFALGRAMIGAGEAGYTTGAYSIIGDSFPREKVSFAMSIFVMGGLMGAGVVFLLGGPLVSAAMDGALAGFPGLSSFKPWQQVFLITGVPGILTALLVFLFPEPARSQPVQAKASGGGYGEALRFILDHKRAYAGIILGIGVVYSVTIGMQVWTPAYLIRMHGWTPKDIGLAMGPAQMIPALTLPLHGWVVDRMYARGRGDAHMLWCLYTLIAAVPFAVTAYLVASPAMTVLLFGVYMVCILSSSSIGPAAAQVVTPPELRGRVSAIFVLVTGLIGMVLGSLAIGFITDKVLGDPARVGTSILIYSAIGLAVSGLLFAQGRVELRQMAGGFR